VTQPIVSAPAPQEPTHSNVVPTAEPSFENVPERPVTIRPMWQIERETIQQAIDYCDGNVLNAAVLLELSPSTVYRKKQAWEAEDEHQTV
jgi:DNA-binding NtrC family response regulator